MTNSLKIYSVSNFHHPVVGELPSLKSILVESCGKKIRRIDRFTQLALIGCFQCKQNIDIPKKTGLYLSSIYGSVNNTFTALKEVFQSNQALRPLSFVNTVSNAACFYLSEQLGLQASNIFTTRENFALEGCIKLARIDLNIGNVDAALLGVVCETGSNIAIHRQHLNVPENKPIAEGSHWLYIAKDLPHKQAIANIVDTKEPLSQSDMLAWISAQQTESALNTALSFGRKVSQVDKENIVNALSIKEKDYLTDKPVHEFPGAVSVCSFIEQCRHSHRNENGNSSNKQRFIHIDTDGNDWWSVIVIDSL